jgi:hypothetical protein
MNAIGRSSAPEPCCVLRSIKHARTGFYVETSTEVPDRLPTVPDGDSRIRRRADADTHPALE